MGVSNRGWGAGPYWRAMSPFAPAIGLIAVQLIWFGMPMGAWIRGVVLGLLIALLAVGMALVYPIIAAIVGRPGWEVGVSAGVASILVIRHQSNIRELIRRDESQLGGV